MDECKNSSFFYIAEDNEIAKALSLIVVTVYIYIHYSLSTCHINNTKPE